MNQSQQALLSRLVDGDLSPAETAEIKALLATDLEAQKVFQEYLGTSLAVASLPRPAIPVDMAERIRPLLKRRPWPVFFDGIGQTIPGWAQAAAGMLIVSIVSTGLHLTFSKSGGTLENQARKIATVAVEDARSDSLPEETLEVVPEKANRESEVASKLSAKADGGLSSLIQDKANTARNLKTPEKSQSERFSQNPMDQFHDGLKKVDRRHAIRIHVPATNSKVEDQVIGILSQFHYQESKILRTTETSADSDTPSLIYLAFIPTRLFEDLSRKLEAIFPKGLERVSPDEFSKIRDQQTSQVVVLDGATLARAREKLADSKVEDRPEKNHFKLGPNGEEVNDAIAQPLEELSGNGPIRSLDGVMIVIRSDLSTDEPSEFGPSTPRKRGILKDPK